MGSIFAPPPPTELPLPALASNVLDLNAWKSKSFMHDAWGNRRDIFAKSSPVDASMSPLPSFPASMIVPRRSKSRPAVVLESSFKIVLPFSGLESVLATFASSAFEDPASDFCLALSCGVITVEPSSACCVPVVSVCAIAFVEGLSCFLAVSDDCGLLPSSPSASLLLLGIPSFNGVLSSLSILPVFALATVVRRASLTFFMASDVAFFIAPDASATAALTTPLTAAIEESFCVGSPPSAVAMDSLWSVPIEV
mmetsp:Transcript_27590/g.45259  ORF Transcript_27590/g.45259 Transcript_27590/m.45259 type:complete len:253 (-) Transcript_27590:29-787(-)